MKKLVIVLATMIMALTTTSINAQPSRYELEEAIDNKMCDWMCNYFRNYISNSIEIYDIKYEGGKDYRVTGVFKWLGFRRLQGTYTAIIRVNSSSNFEIKRICIKGWGNDKAKQHCQHY